jgi:hypothetical protein
MYRFCDQGIMIIRHICVRCWWLVIPQQSPPQLPGIPDRNIFVSDNNLGNVRMA